MAGALQRLIGWDSAVETRGKAGDMTLATNWASGPREPHLGDGEVHVWLADLEQINWNEGELASLLSRDERIRADGFHRAVDRRRYIAVHGLLRNLLAAYVGSNPQELQFTNTPVGKPSLTSAPRPVFFNLSHSEGTALIAVAVGREVGIDAEATQSGEEWPGAAPVALTDRELAALSAVREEGIPSTFVAWWTAKEAYLKARGWGLADLLTIELQMSATGDLTLLADHRDPLAVSAWSFLRLPAIPGYEAHLVVQGGDARRVCWRADGILT